MAYRRERIAPTLFLVTGALGFAWGITSGGPMVTLISITLICVGLVAARDVREDATRQAQADLFKAARDEERERITRGN